MTKFVERKLADSFTVRTMKDSRVVGIMTYLNDWSPAIMAGVLELGRAYAPVVLVLDTSVYDVNRYAVAGDAINLSWLHNCLSQIETGWHLDGNVLASPDQSKVEDRQMMDLVIAALDA